MGYGCRIKEYTRAKAPTIQIMAESVPRDDVDRGLRKRQRWRFVAGFRRRRRDDRSAYRVEISFLPGALIGRSLREADLPRHGTKARVAMAVLVNGRKRLGGRSIGAVASGPDGVGGGARGFDREDKKQTGPRSRHCRFAPWPRRGSC